jgi:hypothetical protein
MKIIVDKLPTKKEDCIFCLIDSIDKKWHKCLFRVHHSDTKGIGGISLSTDDCYLACKKRCPYLKELFSQEDNDTVYVNDKGELIGL